MASRIVRVLRVIEYIGTEEWVHSQIEKRQVKGSRAVVVDGTYSGVIKEAIIGDTSEVLSGWTQTTLKNENSTVDNDSDLYKVGV